MGSKLSPIKYLAVIIVLTFMCGNTLVSAQPFRSEKPIRIETRYSDQLSQVMGSTVVWELLFENTITGFSIHYNISKSKAFCTLEVDTQSTSTGFSLKGPDNKVIDTAIGSFIPFKGFPAPCRVFELKGFTGPQSFKMIRKAGNRKFSNQYSIEIISITVQDAENREWIPVNTFHDKKDVELLLINIKNKNNELLFKQLWEKDGEWWLYEETNESKSWNKF